MGTMYTALRTLLVGNGLLTGGLLTGGLLTGGLLTGCLEFGDVEQGRVIAFDREKGSCTLIRDGGVPGKPNYSMLPPVQYALPDDAAEMGAEPAAGLLMAVDSSSHHLVVYDEAAGAFKQVPFTPISLKEGVDRKDPLVFDRESNKAKAFPQLDRDQRTLTLYVKSAKQLLTVGLADEYLGMPEASWHFGDEVRIYHHGAQKASRFMNVSRTDIYAK